MLNDITIVNVTILFVCIYHSNGINPPSISLHLFTILVSLVHVPLRYSGGIHILGGVRTILVIDTILIFYCIPSCWCRLAVYPSSWWYTHVHYLGGILHPGINHPGGKLYTILSVYIDGIYHHVVCTILMKDVNISSW